MVTHPGEVLSGTHGGDGGRHAHGVGTGGAGRGDQVAGVGEGQVGHKGSRHTEARGGHRQRESHGSHDSCTISTHTRWDKGEAVRNAVHKEQGKEKSGTGPYPHRLAAAILAQRHHMSVHHMQWWAQWKEQPRLAQGARKAEMHVAESSTLGGPTFDPALTRPSLHTTRQHHFPR